MDISNIIDITISVASPGVSRLGFGTPLIYGYNTVIPASEMTREYSTATWSADLIADGFTAADPVYLAASAIASQSPKPRKFKVARGTQDFDHDVDLTVSTDTTGETISVTIYGEDPASAGSMTSETYTQTAGGGGVPAEATALAALITAGKWGAAGDITATGVGNDVQIRAEAAFGASILYYDSLTNVTIEDVTAARTVSTDLDAIFAADPDWYCLVPADAFGANDLDDISDWVNGKSNKICSLATQDSAVITAGGGVAATISAQDDNQTGLIHSKRRLSPMLHAAWVGRFLPETPGEVIWAFESLSGCLPSSYTTAEAGYAHANYCNTYEGVDIGGVEVVSGTVYKGWSQGSSATFMDTIRLIDAVTAQVQTELLGLFTAAKKVPYNDAGIGQVKNAILEAIRVYEGDSAGLLPGSAFCDVPKSSDISAVDKAARELNNVTFGATLNGALTKVTISATLEY